MAVGGGGTLTVVFDDDIDFDNEYSLFESGSYDSGYEEIQPSALTIRAANTYFKIKTKSGYNVSNLFYPTTSILNARANVDLAISVVNDTDNQDDLFYWYVSSGDNDTTLTFHRSKAVGGSSIGNIPMGELTFNGVQSVTYNGTDYTKLVVDGTSYHPVTIISFTIDGTSYQAEEGMTWEEWIISKYNTSGFKIIGSLVLNSSGSEYVADKDQAVVTAVNNFSIIIANKSYVYGSGTPEKET